MKNLFSTCFKKTNLFLNSIILIACLLMFNTIANAGPVSGMALKYSFVSGSTYKITCIVYGNCSSGAGISSLYTATPEICIYNDTTYVATIHLSLQTPEYIEYMCTHNSDSSNCTNASYPYPGIKKFVYTGTYTLPTTSHFWRFIFDGNMVSLTAGRQASITNITASSTIQLIDTLDNTWHNNSSPNITAESQISYCLDSSDSYNPVAVDPDGDSLRYYLIGGIMGTSLCSNASNPGTVTYIYPNTASNPLTSSIFSFDTTNGQMDFTPSVLQNSMAVYNIREYRNDTFIGSSQKEMSFFVTSTCSPTCIDTLPLRIQSVSLQPNISLFPNPAFDICTISCNTPFSKDTKAELYDLTGRLIEIFYLTGKSTEINIRNLNAGIYQFRIIQNNGEIFNKKLIIMK